MFQDLTINLLDIYCLNIVINTHNFLIDNRYRTRGTVIYLVGHNFKRKAL